MVKKEKNEIFDAVKSVATNKYLQITLTIILFLAILISSTQIRLNNLPFLVDQTTGLYTSNDLDSLYFYRIAEAKMANNGVLPDVDILRSPGYNVTWLKELLPDVLIVLYKIEKVFVPTMTFNYSATISAPIIFAMILIAFFFLCLLLTKSKVASLVSCALLAYSPAFLFRSIAGFYDHDHLGVLMVILLLIVFILSLKRFENNWKETVIWGIVLGFFTSLVLASWGGAMTFVFMFLPIAAFLYYLLNNKKKENFLVFYLLWIISSIIFPTLILSKGYVPISMLDRFLDVQGMVSLFVFGFALIDFLFIKFKKNFKFIQEKYEKAYSLGITVVLGLIGLLIIGKSPLDMAKKAWSALIYPFGVGRLGTTVAENAQPYLTDLVLQIGNLALWLFLFGLVIIGVHMASGLKNLKDKMYLSIGSAVVFLAILCSRISSTNLFNGENFISQALYLLGVLAFAFSFIYVYLKDKFNVSVEVLLLFSLSLTVVINARAAIRSFFLIIPFICLIVGYFVVSLFNYSKKTQDDTLKYTLQIAAVVSIILVLVTLFGINPFSSASNGFFQTTSAQSKYVGASANSQWQNSMAWARNNTNPADIFIHWWDYGYFVQTLANRPTVTDGGHSAEFGADINIGRYVLTTPNPITAYSYMKTWNVSYLLIDPTEMGKYGAFSKIGSNDSWDRISTGVISGESNPQNDKETSTGITRIYNLGSCVDRDINYNGTFLPGIVVSKTSSLSCKSAIGGILVEQRQNNGSITFKQPIGAFIYNNKQYNLPIKNLYFNGKMITYPEGIDAVAYIIPKLTQTSDGKVSIDQTGAVIYLSPLVKDSLIGKLYILNDYYKEYTGLQKAYFADDEAVSYLKQVAGESIGDFVYFQGLRAPLKIWKVNYPLGTQTHKEFLDRYAISYGGLDYLFN